MSYSGLHRRQFLSRVIPLVYLFLVFAVFEKRPQAFSEVNESSETTLLAKAKADLQSRAAFGGKEAPEESDWNLFKEFRTAQRNGIHSNNHFFTCFWKQYQQDYQAALPFWPKRFILFSCLRLHPGDLLFAVV